MKLILANSTTTLLCCFSSIVYFLSLAVNAATDAECDAAITAFYSSSAFDDQSAFFTPDSASIRTCKTDDTPKTCVADYSTFHATFQKDCTELDLDVTFYLSDSVAECTGSNGVKWVMREKADVGCYPDLCSIANLENVATMRAAASDGFLITVAEELAAVTGDPGFTCANFDSNVTLGNKPEPEGETDDNVSTISAATFKAISYSLLVTGLVLTLS